MVNVHKTVNLKTKWKTGCLPDHSNQKEKRSLHGRIFCLAYLLHGVRSIHQCTLQDTHFCSQNSRDGEKQNTVLSLTLKPININ